MTRLVGSLLLFLAPHLALAGQLILRWDFPRDSPNQPTSFHIAYTASAAAEAVIEEMTVPPSAVGACDANGPTTADTYCAVWPTCPAPGTVILFWVQAVSPTAVSARSNLALCQFTAAQPCVCLDPGQDVLPAISPAVLPPETTAAHWTEALAAVLSAAPAPAT